MLVKPQYEVYVVHATADSTLRVLALTNPFSPAALPSDIVVRMYALMDLRPTFPVGTFIHSLFVNWAPCGVGAIMTALYSRRSHTLGTLHA